MRQVLDYGMFVRTVNRAGADLPDGSVSKLRYIELVKDEYPPDKGWELVNAEKVGEQAEGITIAFYLQQVKYA